MSMQGESLERRKAIFKEILDENGVHIRSDLAKKFDFREESLKKDIELINGLLEQNGYDFYINIASRMEDIFLNRRGITASYQEKLLSSGIFLLCLTMPAAKMIR